MQECTTAGCLKVHDLELDIEDDIEIEILYQLDNLKESLKSRMDQYLKMPIQKRGFTIIQILILCLIPGIS